MAEATSSSRPGLAGPIRWAWPALEDPVLHAAEALDLREVGSDPTSSSPSLTTTVRSLAVPVTGAATEAIIHEGVQ